MYWHWKGEEEILFYVRIVDQILNLVPDGFTMNTNTIVGGEDGSTTVTISDYPDTTFTDIFKSSKKPNKFIFPVSADYLAVKNGNKPQLRLFNNGIEAVCLTECQITVKSSFPKVTDFNLISNTLTVTFDSAITNIEIYLTNATTKSRDMKCTSIQSSNNLTHTCAITNKVGGEYWPEIVTSEGIINDLVISGKTAISILMTITGISPASAPSIGITTVTLTGTNFPVLAATNSAGLKTLNITFKGSQCVTVSSTNTHIICDLKKDSSASTSENFTVSYNGVNMVDSTGTFAWSTSSTIPTVNSLSPMSVSPGEKQLLTLVFAADLENNSSYPKSGMAVSIEKKDDLTYKIAMNIVSLTTTTMKVAYPGAKPGKYILKVLLKQGIYAQHTLADFDVSLTITSINKTEGSTKEGTTLVIIGTNFLSTAVNQMIFVYKSQCNYISGVSNTKTQITCKTSEQLNEDLFDKPLDVVVTHMIQYESTCKDTSTNCKFTYKKLKTPSVEKISTALVHVGTSITITGNNFNISNGALLNFSWGTFTVNSQTSASGSTSATLTGTVATVTKYRNQKFDMTNSHGFAEIKDGVTSPFITTIAAPTIGSISPAKISPNGGIVDIVWSSVDGFSNTSGPISLTICRNTCTANLDVS
ncbi:MAG: hypothetical protein GY861_15320, partial [bacterium]|nr:hypothetical protein [bacterium]